MSSKGIFQYGHDKFEEVFPIGKGGVQDGYEDWDIPRLRLKASAVEALSWGLQHSVSIPDE